MTTPHLHGTYGSAPALLATAATDAVQYSPLIPGSARLDDVAPGSMASMVALAPAGTVERRYTLALALRALDADASLTVLGHKDKGGSRIGAELRQFGCTVTEDSRQHHRICTTTKPAGLNGIDDAIAAGSPQLVTATGLWSQPGVFSWNRLDPGSALLLHYLPPLAGRGADLGCGIGTLALSVLISPTLTELTLIDIDLRAVKAAKRNISDPRVTMCWADVRQPLGLRNLDFVIMNPPFHDGGIEDKSLGLQFVEQAAAILRPGGICWLTANRHLPYEGLMHQRFRTVTCMGEADGFKIYKAEK